MKKCIKVPLVPPMWQCKGHFTLQCGRGLHGNVALVARSGNCSLKTNKLKNHIFYSNTIGFIFYTKWGHKCHIACKFLKAKRLTV